VVAAAMNPTLFAFNYVDINRLSFDSFGGENAGFGYTGANFVMDNMTIEFIPEPSSLLLTTLGATVLLAAVRRRRT
jgi:hypothetical protein